MQAEVKWVEDFKFLGQSQSGHSIVMDGNGGATAPSPMEMVDLFVQLAKMMKIQSFSESFHEANYHYVSAIFE